MFAEEDCTILKAVPSFKITQDSLTVTGARVARDQSVVANPNGCIAIYATFKDGIDTHQLSNLCGHTISRTFLALYPARLVGEDVLATPGSIIGVLRRLHKVVRGRIELAVLG